MNSERADKLPLKMAMMRRSMHLAAHSEYRRLDIILNTAGGGLTLTVNQVGVDAMRNSRVVTGRFSSTPDQLIEMAEWLQDQAAFLAEFEERKAICAERDDLAELEAEATR